MNTYEAGTLIGEMYAKTLFELAEQEQLVDAVKSDFDALTAVFAAEQNFATFLASPYFSCEHRQQLIEKIFSGKFTALIVNFLKVVIRHNRTRFLPQMIERYSELWDNSHGFYKVRATVSRAMDDAEVQRLSEDIAVAMKAGVRLQLAVDPSIIGGIIIRYGNSVIDNTVTSRLRHAVQTITNQEKRQKKSDEI
jgi:F-type H+-transporting ATPase subunit delta